jgi:hypothetical protein
MITQKLEFPKLSKAAFSKILSLPQRSEKPLRVILDTDFDNEVDDYFALSWLILQEKYPSKNLNKIKLEAIHIAPFSFKTRLNKLLKAYSIFLLPISQRKPKQRQILDSYVGQIKAIIALGMTPLDLAKDPHLNGDIIIGIEKSYKSVLNMCKLMKYPSSKKVFKGATRFMKKAHDPVVSNAARNLVKLAL